MIDLYYFALRNHRYFSAGKQQVIVISPEVLDQFNEKIDHTNQLREQFQTASKIFEQNQESFFADLGVSAHDFGLQSVQ